MKIRAETWADWQAIEAVTVAAFSAAPHTSHTEQHIVNALRKVGKLSVSLVAEMNGAIAGHLAMSPVAISDGARGWFGLGPVSVLPQYQRHGIGSQLVREALRIIRRHGAAGCVVLGDPHYYSRFGFSVNPDLGLPGFPAEYFQTRSFDSSQPRGIVSYDEAFAAIIAMNSHGGMRWASVDLQVERATDEDRDAMATVLAACGLSSFGILNPGTLYWVCRARNGLVGLCGLEVGQRCALLRSVCVVRSERGKGIAERLVRCALGEATRLDLPQIYLFSKDTGDYFERLGWREVPVAEVAARLPQAPQVRRYEEIGWYPDERAFVRTVA